MGPPPSRCRLLSSLPPPPPPRKVPHPRRGPPPTAAGLPPPLTWRRSRALPLGAPQPGRVLPPPPLPPPEVNDARGGGGGKQPGRAVTFNRAAEGSRRARGAGGCFSSSPLGHRPPLGGQAEAGGEARSIPGDLQPRRAERCSPPAVRFPASGGEGEGCPLAPRRGPAPRGRAGERRARRGGNAGSAGRQRQLEVRAGGGGGGAVRGGAAPSARLHPPRRRRRRLGAVSAPPPRPAAGADGRADPERRAWKAARPPERGPFSLPLPLSSAPAAEVGHPPPPPPRWGAVDLGERIPRERPFAGRPPPVWRRVAGVEAPRCLDALRPVPRRRPYPGSPVSRRAVCGDTVGAGRGHGAPRSARTPLVPLGCLPALGEGKVRGWWSADRRLLPFSARQWLRLARGCGAAASCRVIREKQCQFPNDFVFNC